MKRLDKQQILADLKERQKNSAPHELSASTDYIEEHIGFTAKYTRGYWLKKIKDKGLTDFQVRGLVNEALSLNIKYEKGGWLTNQMK